MKSICYLTLILFISVNIAFARTTEVCKRAVPLYGTFEFTIKAPGIKGNKFRKFASVVFSNKNRRFNVDGFFDGGDTWRVNFMPDNVGVWNYSYSIERYSGNGSFFCTAKKNNDIHGHVKIDPDTPRYLIHEDGTVHYWFGSLWFRKQQYGPHSINGVPNAARQSDEKLLSTLDIIEEYKHNGALLKISLFPIENDKLTWNLSWINRAEWLVKEMGKRGIYCHINMFDTWSRDKDFLFKSNTDGRKHVFNVWSNEDDVAKKNYIRTIVARFAGLYNIYWELGNEMEHYPNSGDAFVAQANEKYIPWIRQYDPYDLPIGLSEGIWKKTNVDIGFLHQTNRLPDPHYNKPTIMNELVRGGIKNALWKDSTIRESKNRLAYRRTFWQMFTYGGCGSSEATLLHINDTFNQAVLDVMGDQQRFREFIESLPASINDMDTDSDFVVSGPGKFSTRRKKRTTYVCYFLLEPEEAVAESTVRVLLPKGNYEYVWFNPGSGLSTDPSQVMSVVGTTSINHPAFVNDIVLKITKAIPLKSQ